jgi:LacI family transcriptional regulator
MLMPKILKTIIYKAQQFNLYNYFFKISVIGIFMQTFALRETIDRATILDIARELHLNASTVSRALNDNQAISIATRERVRKAAKRLKYQHNQIASSLRLGKTNIIGVIIPSAEINFFGSVVHGIEKVANERNYNIIIYQSNELTEIEKKGIVTFLRSRVEGVLASIAKETINFDHYREIKKTGVPLVLFDRANDDLGVPSVVIDDYQGAYNATVHLIKQGCKKIAHIGAQQHVAIFKQRLNGYVDALKEHDIAVHDEFIKYASVTIESGRECMKQLLGMKQHPDAVFAVEDFTALGAIQAIKAANKKIPEEIAIFGFANETFGEFITPSLSTVDQQTIKMGEAAANLFFDMLERKSFYSEPPKKLVLKPKLIFRESSLKKL